MIICGKHCLHLKNLQNTFDLNYYYVNVLKKFLNSENILLKFKECGCPTHRLCLMNYIHEKNLKTSFSCPSCDKNIIKDYENILSLASVKTLNIENNFKNGIIYNDSIFEIIDIDK